MEDLVPSVTTVVTVGPDDRSLLLELMREFWAGEGLPWDDARVAGAVDGMLGDPRHGRAWIARRDGRPVGYAIAAFGFSVEYGGVDAFVDELYVRPEHRGRGVGTALLDVLESGCRDAGAAVLHLEVDHANEGGQRLYRRLGFVDHARYLMTKPIARESARSGPPLQDSPPSSSAR